MMEPPPIRMASTVIGSPDPPALARFYERLLGWPIAHEEDVFVIIRDPGGGAGLSFQLEPGHVPPTWPPVDGEQQMMMHLDIGVADLEAGVSWALGSGATLESHQPQSDVRVMRDPDGHLFCLFPDDLL